MRGIVFWICTILMQEDYANRKCQTSWIDFQSVDSPKSNVLRAMSKSTGTSEQWFWFGFFYNKLPAVMTEDLTRSNLQWDVQKSIRQHRIYTRRLTVRVRISSRKWKHVLDSFGKRQREKKTRWKKVQENTNIGYPQITVNASLSGSKCYLLPLSSPFLLTLN